MDLDQILAPNAAPLIEPGATPGAWTGEVISPPDGDNLIRVVVRGYTSDLGEVCRYISPAAAPAAGDECLVVFANTGLPWALFANPAAQALKMGIASSFSLPYNTFTLATVDTVRFGDEALHTVGGVPSRSMFAVDMPGVYRGVAYAEFAAAAGGNRWLSVMRANAFATENVAALAPATLGGLIATPVTVPFEALLDEGEWFQFHVWQNQTSAAALDVTKLTFAIDRVE